MIIADMYGTLLRKLRKQVTVLRFVGVISPAAGLGLMFYIVLLSGIICPRFPAAKQFVT